MSQKKQASPQLLTPTPGPAPNTEVDSTESNAQLSAQVAPTPDGGTPVLEAAEQSVSAPSNQGNATTQSGGESESTVSTGLGDAADAIASRSPTLRSTLDSLQSDGWTVVWGTAGGGSFADRPAKRITVDPNGSGDAAGLVQTLAHEAGHADYDIDGVDPYVDFGSLTRDEYVDQNTMRCLRDEAEATIMNLEVRDELNQGDDAVDIGVAGAGQATYIQEWERFKAGDITRAELVTNIANAFAHGESPSTGGASDYYDYYANTYRSHWDANHPSGTP